MRWGAGGVSAAGESECAGVSAGGGAGARAGGAGAGGVSGAAGGRGSWGGGWFGAGGDADCDGEWGGGGGEWMARALLDAGFVAGAMGFNVRRGLPVLPGRMGEVRANA